MERGRVSGTFVVLATHPRIFCGARMRRILRLLGFVYGHIIDAEGGLQ